MILPLFRRDPNQTTIRTFYGAIVAQARLPCFYSDFGVPDTVSGRFDLIVLHAVLVLRRLRREGAMETIGQGVFDTFCRDMDDNLREMGVSDLGVPREMKKLAEAFYGRSQAYDAALAETGHETLIAALRRNLYPDGEAGEAAAALAAYVRAVDRALADQDQKSFMRGEPQFPDPARFIAAIAAAERG
jgi:cytochrome b pre-mRNA-processing protein 3